MKTAPSRAATKASQRSPCRSVAASAVPTSTGATAAGRVRGRAAMSQMRVALAGTTAQSTLQAVLVDAWLPRAAAARPDVPAVNTLRDAALHAVADAGARRLAARGARAGDRVGLALPAGEAFAVALHACLRLGAVAVPLDLRLPEAERARRAAGCAVVVAAPLDEGDGDERAPLSARHD